jgi:hypothetical protein
MDIRTHRDAYILARILYRPTATQLPSVSTESFCGSLGMALSFVHFSFILQTWTEHWAPIYARQEAGFYRSRRPRKESQYLPKELWSPSGQLRWAIMKGRGGGAGSFSQSPDTNRVPVLSTDLQAAKPSWCSSCQQRTMIDEAGKRAWTRLSRTSCNMLMSLSFHSVETESLEQVWSEAYVRNYHSWYSMENGLNGRKPQKRRPPLLSAPPTSQLVSRWRGSRRSCSWL